MKPYFEHDGITLYHGRAEEVLPQLPESVDLIATSPPYNCRKEYHGFKDQMAWPEYYELAGKVLDECYARLCVGGVLALNVPGVVRWQAEHEFAETWGDFDPKYNTHRNGEKVIGKGRIEPIGFRLFDMMQRRDRHMREPIVWVKGSEGNAICSDYRMGCDSDPYMRPAHELILLGSKAQWFHRGGTGRRGGDAVPFLDATKDVWFVTPERDGNHPAVFPVEIPDRLIRLFTHASDAVVCDPFAGRGSTLIAAKQRGRQAVGIEISELYCRRIVDRFSQLGLFNEQAATMTLRNGS